MFCNKCGSVFDITDVVKARPAIKEDEVDVGELIENMLDGTVDLKQLEYTDKATIIQHPKYNEVEPEQRSMILHTLSTYFSDIKKEPIKVKSVKKDLTGVYYECSNCKNYKPVTPGTLIYSKNVHRRSDMIDLKMYSIYDDNMSLPRDGNYDCVNEKCPSHDDPRKKERTELRVGEWIVYTCCECLITWKQ